MSPVSPEHHKASTPSSLASSQISPRTTIHYSSYLTVPSPSHKRRLRANSSATSAASPPAEPLPPPSTILASQPIDQDPPGLYEQEIELPSTPDFVRILTPSIETGYAPMSNTSTTSADSEYSNPPARVYEVPRFDTMSDPSTLSQADIQQHIQALRTHRVNTLVELRRIERIFAAIGTAQVTEPMTLAWAHYVNSHSLLTELRALTKNYPFSSDCLNEAKRRVYSDPSSNRSWNTCWLVLVKIQTDQLIPYYAQWEASQPTMWGGVQASDEQIRHLTAAFVAEWNYALSQMLRHWEIPPCR